MTYQLYGNIKDQVRKQNTFLKTQHNTYDKHIPFNPFKTGSLDTTNLKQHKRFNFNQGIQEEHIDYLHNSFRKEPTIAYFQAKVPPFVAYRENRGNTISYNTMVRNNGWN